MSLLPRFAALLLFALAPDVAQAAHRPHPPAKPAPVLWADFAHHPAGYLSPADRPDALVFLPPPPGPDTPRGKADRAAYGEAKALEGTPRWAEATADADVETPGAPRAFTCAAGVDLDPNKTPATSRLLARVMDDVAKSEDRAKDAYARKRPFLTDDGDTCVDKPDWLVKQGSYPSGHAATGWAWALILSELEPKRAGALLTRGISFGQSRVVCRVHFVSDVEAGRLVGAAVVARLHANGAFLATSSGRRRSSRPRADPPPSGAQPRCSPRAAGERLFLRRLLAYRGCRQTGRALMQRMAWLCMLGSLLAAGAAQAQSAVPAATPALAQTTTPAMAPAPLPKVEPYLGKDRIPNAILILPPPPVKGSIADQLDNDTYAKTRALAGGERWALATRDATQYLQAFECPLGLRVADWPKPVAMLLARMGRDASSITNLAKDHFNHPRPFIAPNGPICTESDRGGLMKSYSYPSGHGTYSWALGLLLAGMAPEHATELLARARAFGESRVVCGVHTVSDIEEARTNGSVLVAALHGDAAFREDLLNAGKALRAALAAPHAAPDAGQCRIEADAEAHTPWINPTATK